LGNEKYRGNEDRQAGMTENNKKKKTKSKRKREKLRKGTRERGE